jgi:hypothetical protein
VSSCRGHDLRDEKARDLVSRRGKKLDQFVAPTRNAEEIISAFDFDSCSDRRRMRADHDGV